MSANEKKMLKAIETLEEEISSLKKKLENAERKRDDESQHTKNKDFTFYKDEVTRISQQLQGLQTKENILLQQQAPQQALSSTPGGNGRNMFTDTLPPLKLEGGRTLTSKSSVPSSGSHRNAELIDGKFHILKELNLDKLNLQSFKHNIWDSVREGDLFIKFQNESSVQDNVGFVVNNAMQAANLADTLDLVKEVEVMRCRPDYMVIFVRGRVIGAIDVKQPSSKAMSDDNILGEVYDQLMHLRTVFGVETPFAILTSYTQWRICWLDDENSNKIAEMDTLDVPDAPTATPTKKNKSEEGDEGKANICFQTPQSKRMDKSGSPPAPATPSRLIAPPSYIAAKDDDVKDIDMQSVEPRRRIRASEVKSYKDPQLGFMIISVLKKMMASKFTVVKHKHGESISQVLRVANENTYCWSKVTYKEGLRFTSTIPTDVKNFAIWEELGSGADGRAYLVSGGVRGSVGVAKFFFRHERANAALEADNWEKVYTRGRLPQVASVRVIRLMGLPHAVLLMPWFATPKRDQTTLDAVLDTLTNDFAKRGLVHHDVKWRNVGTYSSAEGVLRAVVFDMSTVREVTDADVGWVENSVASLRLKME